MKKTFIYFLAELISKNNNSINWKFCFSESGNSTFIQEIVVSASESLLIELGFLHYDWSNGIHPTSEELVKIEDLMLNALIDFMEKEKSFPLGDIFYLDNIILSACSNRMKKEIDLRGKYEVDVISLE